MIHQTSFPCVYGGEAAVVFSLRPRSFVDILFGQVRVDFATSYCSPSDRRDRYKPGKGHKIATERLLAYRRGRTSLRTRGFAGTLVCSKKDSKSMEQIISYLRDDVYYNTPHNIWSKHEKKEQAQLIRSYFELTRARNLSDYRVKSRKDDLAAIREQLPWLSVDQLRQFLAAHTDAALTRLPTAKQSLAMLNAILDGTMELKIAPAPGFTDGLNAAFQGAES